MRRKWFFIAPAAIVGIVLFAFIGGEVVKLLWNWLVPPLFGRRQITFWEALGLLALCRILFGGRGFHTGGARSRARQRIQERLDAMTPEERERFRHTFRGRHGFGPPASESKAQ
jgi:hypothetical protein